MENTREIGICDNTECVVTKADEVKDDLDSLLDDAIEDFNKPLPGGEVARNGQEDAESESEKQKVMEEWTQEFIQEASKNFDMAMKSLLKHQHNNADPDDSSENQNDSTAGATAPPLDVNAISEEFVKFAEVAAKATSEVPSDSAFTKCLSETMSQMAQNTQDAQTAPSADELNNMLQSLGLGVGEGEGGDAPSELDGLFPLMQTMLENVLSKDVLYPPIKDIVNKFPDWLADNGPQLPPEEFDKYNKQYDLMKKVCDAFESETEDQAKVEKEKNFEAVLKYMQKLQELGNLPKELVGDFGPGIAFDNKGSPVLPDMASLLGAGGFAASPDGNNTQDQCSLM